MEAKVKEEVPDKDYSQPTTTERRKSTPGGKERRSPVQDEGRVSPTPGPPSPQNNGTAGLSSTESLSPPLAESRAAPALQRLRRFLSALQQFATDVGPDTADRVRQLIFNLVAGVISIEEFQTGVQESTNYPLRASVPGFLRALLPLAQRDLLATAARAKQTPLQYIRSHEHLVLESGVDGGDLFPAHDAVKRRASDPFYEAQTNGAPEEYGPHAKRPPSLFLNPSPFLYPAGPGLFDYGHPYPGYHGPGEHSFERRDGGITVRDVSSMTAPFPDSRGGLLKTDDEWRNINTMLNCILSMVEKTKRALAILQQRGCSSVPEPSEGGDMKRASDMMAAALRHTEERVAEARRRAEDAVNQVKRQALLELQRAVGAAEVKALELERRRRPSPPPPPPPPPPARDLSPTAASQQNCCWNCGRKAAETCSGCGAARYCGAFCQHKDWENHHQVCSGRDQKPPARTSPPSKPPRSSTPLAAPIPVTTPLPLTPERLPTHPDRIPLSSERIITQDRSLASDRMLTNITTAQGLIGIGKK